MPPRYPLSDNQKEFLETGSPPQGTRRGRLDDKITGKVEMLSDRFSVLFEDVTLLKRSGYLSSEEWQESWPQLALDAEIERLQAQVLQAHTRPIGHGFTPVGFGYNLGRTAGRLALCPKQVAESDFIADLVWGFMEGIRHGHEPNPSALLDADEVSSYVDETLPEIEKRATIATEETKEGHGEMMEFEEQIQSVREWVGGLHQEVRAILDAEGVEADWTVGVVSNAIENRSKSPASLSQIAYGEVPDPEEIVSEEIVRQIISERDIRKEYKLRVHLDADVERLDSKRWRRVDATSVFESVAQSDGRKGSADLARELGEAQKDVTRMAKDLAGQARPPDSPSPDAVWCERPILNGNQERWELTDYGKMLYKYIEQKELPDWVDDAVEVEQAEQVGLPVSSGIPDSDELIDKALSELEGEDS